MTPRAQAAAELVALLAITGAAAVVVARLADQIGRRAVTLYRKIGA